MISIMRELGCGAFIGNLSVQVTAVIAGYNRYNVKGAGKVAPAAISFLFAASGFDPLPVAFSGKPSFFMTP
ncbi:MAG: hypothetical protein IT210_00870 [Armatimonadetes bacterium]|nr:hypothetical protein [Armatimonadota bacterium]